MRLLPNVIKPSQYKNAQHVTTPIITTDDAASVSAKNNNGNANDKVILSSAFEKAKQIVEAANNYSVTHIKEATQRMNEECAEVRKQSYNEAHAKGLAQGKEQGVKVGYDEGYKKGYNEGLNKAKEENEELYQSLTLIVEAFENAKKTLVEKEEENLSDLAIQIAETILQKNIKSDKKAISSIIESIVDDNHNKEWIKINLSKDVYDVLKKNKFDERLKSICDGAKLYHSRELDNSECIIETQDEVIDASVESQLNKIKSVLKK